MSEVTVSTPDAQATLPVHDQVATTIDAVEFLQGFFGNSPWPLVAIRKNPTRIQAKTFVSAADRDGTVSAWIHEIDWIVFDI